MFRATVPAATVIKVELNFWLRHKSQILVINRVRVLRNVQQNPTQHIWEYSPPGTTVSETILSKRLFSGNLVRKGN